MTAGRPSGRATDQMLFASAPMTQWPGVVSTTTDGPMPHFPCPSWSAVAAIRRDKYTQKRIAATADQLGQEKFGIGPSVVVLTTPGHWVIGALANNIWSVAGHEGRPAVNQFLLQYFVNYNLKKGWYLTSAPIITANWEANSGDRWNVPFGAGVGRIMKVGFQPMNFSVAFFGNAASTRRLALGHATAGSAIVPQDQQAAGERTTRKEARTAKPTATAETVKLPIRGTALTMWWQKS